MSFPRALVLFSFAALAIAGPLSTAAEAQSVSCPGRNLLDDIKAKDASAFARIKAAAVANKNGSNVLWKIENEEKPDRPASYLFATLGVSDLRLQALSPAVSSAMNAASRIALEVDETTNARTQEAVGTMTNALLPDGGTNPKLESLLAKPEASRANLMLVKSGLSQDLVPRAKPWVAMLAASTSDCERERLKQGKLTLDAELARLAESRGVGSFGLESTEMKLGAFAELSDAEQLSLLKATLAGFDRIDDQTETLVQLYLAHDIGAIWPLLEELTKRHGADATALESYRKHVLDERNTRMRDRMLMHLATGNVFVAVGAMHLPGDNGIVELLREAGYTLTAVE